MAAKSAEFRQRGGEVYLPADVVRANASAEAEETVAEAEDSVAAD